MQCAAYQYQAAAVPVFLQFVANLFNCDTICMHAYKMHFIDDLDYPYILFP